MGRIGDRIAALERDIAQAERDRRLEGRWKRELQEAIAQQRHTSHFKPVPRDGVDYAFGRPHGGALVRAGVTFVARYIDSGGGKDLSRTEAEDLSHAGLDLIVCRETSADFMGESAGGPIARQALRAAHAAGMPEGRPVFYVHDLEGDIARGVRFLRDAIDATSAGQVGAYGGLAFIEAAHQAGVRYLWQTLAWSGGRWSPHAQLRQTKIETGVANTRVDLDRAVAADFGQWQVS